MSSTRDLLARPSAQRHRLTAQPGAPRPALGRGIKSGNRGLQDPATHVGYELIAVGMLILEGDVG